MVQIIEIDIQSERSIFYTKTLEGGTNASLLYEVPQEERDEQSESYKDEEWQTSNSGSLPDLRN